MQLTGVNIHWVSQRYERSEGQNYYLVSPCGSSRVSNHNQNLMKKAPKVRKTVERPERDEKS